MKKLCLIGKRTARLTILTLSIALCVPCTSIALSNAATLIPTWSNAELVPGSTALNAGNSASLGPSSISCTSIGNCSAGGTYKDDSGNRQAFVVDEVKGRWGDAFEIPGLGAMNTGGDVTMNALACASPGNCGAGGSYKNNASGIVYAYLVSEVAGQWGNAQTVGISSLGTTTIDSISCPSPGNCTAGGSYVAVTPQNFVIDETNGNWGTPQQVPNLNVLNQGAVGPLSISCASAGNCSASATYTDGSGHVQGYVVSEANGAWGNSQEIPGLGVLNAGNSVEVTSISCASAGNCSAGGTYYSNPLVSQAFVVNEVGGSWSDAQLVPGSEQLNVGGSAVMRSISCTTPGNCSAGGGYSLSSGGSEVFVVDEVNGTWGSAVVLPGSQQLNTAEYDLMNVISCSSPGNCSAGGQYNVDPGSESFYADEVNGVWGQAIQVPGSLALGVGSAVNSLSCSADGYCAAGGASGDGSGINFQVFIAEKPAPSSAPSGPSSPTSLMSGPSTLSLPGFNLLSPTLLLLALFSAGGLTMFACQVQRRKGRRRRVTLKNADPQDPASGVAGSLSHQGLANIGVKRDIFSLLS